MMLRISQSDLVPLLLNLKRDIIDEIPPWFPHPGHPTHAGTIHKHFSETANVTKLAFLYSLLLGSHPHLFFRTCCNVG